jgi:hypothetical protein
MELQYLNALEEYNLQKSDLPEDAQIGIEQIESVIEGMKLNEKRGKQISEKTFKKLKAMDKWVYYEILDFVNDTEKNEEEMPYDSDEVVEEMHEHDEEDDLPDEHEDDEEDETTYGDESIGKKIDEQLNRAYQDGLKTISLEDLKKISREGYNVIFEGYEENGDNGLETNNFSLIETDEYIFTLTRK